MQQCQVRVAEKPANRRHSGRGLKLLPNRGLLKSSQTQRKPPLTDFVLDEFLPYRLTILATRLSEQFAERYRAKFGISVPEWRLVAHLSQAEKVSIREVYQRVAMDKSKTSRAAARLEKAGYVNKRTNPADRRLVELSLTAKGHAMSAEIGRMGIAFQGELLIGLEPEDREKFHSMIETMLKENP
ncbi:MAG: winged helix-turn-helix transcriptional regulator [Rhodobacteraceae bacterium]|nr:winged helix-turn-helix transcriptional regulator [Paracoccaceae bacterium]